MSELTAPAPHWLAGPLATAVRLICGAGARWVGPGPGNPHGRQCIFFANHTSHLDPVVIWAALPRSWRAVARPIAARDYWVKSAVRRFLSQRVFRAVLIDRAPPATQQSDGERMPRAGADTERVERARAVVEATLAEMGSEFSVILFPEGTRGSGEEPARFKSGLYYIAKAKPTLELVPVYLENLGRILPKGEFLPVPLLATATFGSPLRLAEGEARDAFLERARAAILALRRA